jgi:protein-L-isoaspartate(D-aspartate) O-methyltransferase
VAQRLPAVAAFVLMACGGAPSAAESPAQARERMVREQIEARGVRDARTLAALRKVERHRFVPPEVASLAYADHPLPIGEDQTISQPYIVAVMTEAIRLQPGEKVLEVGTGSGYQAAVLAEAGARVYTIEIVPSLAAEAKARLAELGYRAVHVRQGNGWAGWPEEAPFDAIVRGHRRSPRGPRGSQATAPRRRSAGHPRGRRQPGAPAAHPAGRALRGEAAAARAFRPPCGPAHG